ncbi:MAG: hypothetical protein J6F30_05065 [Cellulosilyticum sp.]|nr:hypothetical protein [Cellulosilyticum sp.]
MKNRLIMIEGIPGSGKSTCAKKIEAYLLELLKNVEKYHPLLIYLTQKDVEETITRVARKRVSPDKSKWEDWIDLVIHSVEKSKYGKEHHLEGRTGVVQYYKDRKAIELEYLHKLEEEYAGIADIEIVHNDNYDWEKLDKKLKEIVEHAIRR